MAKLSSLSSRKIIDALRRAGFAVEGFYLRYLLHEKFGWSLPEKEADRQAEEAARRYAKERLEQPDGASAPTADALPPPPD